jgi:hypothetical protein
MASLPEITKREQEPQAKPWRCEKCGEKVFVSPELHSFLCKLYQDRKQQGGVSK